MSAQISLGPLTGHGAARKRLLQCSKRLQDRVNAVRNAKEETGNPADAWLLEHRAYIQFQIAETRGALPPAYIRGLPHTAEREPRIYRIAAGIAAEPSGVIDADVLSQTAEALKKETELRLSELWAFGSMLTLALLERLCADLEFEPNVSLCIRSLRALENVSWRDFVESVSAVDRVLRGDPAGVYSQMDFVTRDRYRHEVEELARGSRRLELEVAEAVRSCAENALLRDGDSRKGHAGYYLVGAGAQFLRQQLGYKAPLRALPRKTLEHWPGLFYFSGIAFLTALLTIAFYSTMAPCPLWIVALVLIPASQAASEIVNGLVSRFLAPRVLPSMDFSAGVAEDCKTMVVVPTLLLSRENSARLLEDLETRYVANRGPNVYFALLTDFPDADVPETENDSVLAHCIEGIGRLNARYGGRRSGPFYLCHRSRRWNPVEAKWMGYERKRGKLMEFNRLLLGRGNWFDTIVGDMSVLLQIRYVITLDTDTQLPRDTAAKLIAAMAHPLNRPILDARTRTVREGYALMQPRVSVSMESSGKSWLAHIFSGQTGFDPYTTAVSDVYQDLFGKASFTGKGIYDVAAFDAVVGRRFPENAILSHDLIEGEHGRTGLLTGVEVIDDYPTTYRAFSKRKHRWIRGDWQILPWLFPCAPGRVANRLTFLSRWKIFDNLRRSLFEISVALLFLAGWLFADGKTLWTLGVLVLLQLSSYADLMLTLVRTPERRFWPAFLRDSGERFVRSHRDLLVNLILLPHQACLAADAIVRSLVRRFITKRNLLEWETMAQSDLPGGTRIGMVEKYLYFSSAACLAFWATAAPWNWAVSILCAIWVSAPAVVDWLNSPLPKPAALPESDREFLRGVAVRTWRYFADHARSENHWLAPDNVQQDPPSIDRRISPTNLGLQLTANLAAHDLGYITLDELSVAECRIFGSMRSMQRERGHFFNWYDTQTLHALQPRYVSTVDSGNLAASLCAVRQGCLSLLREPAIAAATLDGLRDYALRLREAIPYAQKCPATMRLIESLLRQLVARPTNLFFWEGVLTDAAETVRRIRQALAATLERLGQRRDRSQIEEIEYWEGLLVDRTKAALAELFSLAPWLEASIEPELRVNIRDLSLAPLMEELLSAPPLAQLPDAYERIRQRVMERLDTGDPLYPALRAALETLLQRLPDARARALELIHRLESAAADASRFFDAMDFRFLFDKRRKLLRIGYDTVASRADESCYDLLASEARSAVFLAIAKGDIPREAWFRLGRKLTVYRNHRTLVSWSGTMFEYLMPLLHMRSYENTLLDRGLRGAILIQQVYAEERGVPWGISEAACATRDSSRQYQYHPFGVPPMSAKPHRVPRLVIAPYATMLAVMLAPAKATDNLRRLAAQGWLQRYGFFDAIDYSLGDSPAAPEAVRCFMVHHQGMGLLSLHNVLCRGRMQELFHADPVVQSTEYLLQERIPALVESLADENALAAGA